LARLWSVDPGFNPSNVLTFSISLPPSMMKASPEAIRAAFRQLDDKLASVPGVQATSVSWGSFPLQGDDESLFWMEGQPRPSSQHDMNWALNYVVGPDYLKAMRIPLLHGRFLDAHDDEHAPLVAVVDEVFVAKFFPNQDPIGKRINMDGNNKSNRTLQIVGVVKHVKQWGLAADDQMLRTQMYRPFMQLPDDGMALAPSGTGVVVRSQGEPSGVLDSIRSVVRQMSREQVIFGAQTMDETISSSLATRRYFMILLGLFAALALVLASVGIYGVISYIVGQRTHEIGIRMALGARRIHVLGLVLRQGMVLVLIGIAAGTAAALALTRLMASLLFGVSATDPVTFLCVAAMLMLLALSACAVPARRATRVDPLLALRHE
jgi:predicted permease